MSDSHGSTPAAWTAVALSLVGFTVGGIAMIIGPNWLLFWIGCVLVVIAPVVGLVMSNAGLGGDRSQGQSSPVDAG